MRVDCLFSPWQNDRQDLIIKVMDTKRNVDIDQDFLDFTDRLRQDKFYGVVEVHYQAGKVVRVKKHETILAKDLSGFKPE